MAAPPPMLAHLRRLVQPSASELGSDADLLARFARTRDQAAFAALVARHGPMVYRLCWRVLGDGHAAEDAVQAAFVILARKAAHLRHPESLAAWLHGTAYRLALKMRAAEQRRRQVETHNRPIPSSAPADPLAELSARELLTVLDAELQRLPERYRLPVILCCLEGRTQPEAARLLGWTAGSVKGRLERGRAELHRRLLRRGLTLSAALLALEAAQATAGRMPAGLAAVVVKAADAPAGALSWTEMIAGLAGTKMKVVLLLAVLLGVAAAGMSWLPQANPEAKQAESSQPVQQDKERARTDRYGDPLPPGALARLGTVRWRLPLFGVDRMVASSDGKTLVTVNPLRGVSVWEIATGRILRNIPQDLSSRPEWLGGNRQVTTGHSGAAQRATALSADGRTAVFASAAGPLFVVDIPTGKMRQRCEGFQGMVQETTLSADGKVLASRSEDGTLRVWDASTGKQIHRLPLAKQEWVQYQPTHLALSPDGKTLAWIGTDKDRPIHIYDVSAGEEKSRLLQHPGEERCIIFSPKGDLLLATCNKGPAQLWDVRTGRLVRTLPHKGNFHPPEGAFAPDGGTLALAIQGEALRLHEVATGKELWRAPGRMASTAPDVLAFAPDGKTWKSLDLWECAGWRKRLELPPVTVIPCPLAFSPDGSLFLVGDSDGAVRIYDSHTGRLLRRQEGHRATVNRFVFSHDGRKLVTVSQDTTALVWDIADLLRTARGREVEIPLAELRSLWDDLAAADAVKGYRAIGKLSRSRKQVIPWLREHLWPVPAGDPQRIARLVAQLEDDRFEVREKATRELAALGESAVPALRKALAGQPALELRRRAETLLKRTEELSPERLRTLRSVEVIESIGGAEAEALLKEWSQGAAGACLTREAKAALERLAKRRTAS